jgi:hypothetical protein
MNFRRPRDKRHAFAMTHHASVADRIDRSYSPRGGREERELDFWFRTSMIMRPFAALARTKKETAVAGFYCNPLRPIRCVHG